MAGRGRAHVAFFALRALDHPAGMCRILPGADASVALCVILTVALVPLNGVAGIPVTVAIARTARVAVVFSATEIT